MERRKISIKEIGFKRLALLFCAGLLLVFLSFSELFLGESEEANLPVKDTDFVSNTELETKVNSQSGTNGSKAEYYENKLKEILKKIKGIGEVEVMLTMKSSDESIILKDAPYSQETLNEVDSSGGSRISSNVTNDESTVMIKDAQGNMVPYVTKELEAEVEGILILAEGARNGSIAADITTAAEVLFGVPAHKVKVLELGK